MCAMRRTPARWAQSLATLITTAALVQGCAGDEPEGTAPRDAGEDLLPSEAGPSSPAASAPTTDAQTRPRDAGERPGTPVDARVAAATDSGTPASGPTGGGDGGTPGVTYALDCGPNGVAIESAGPPQNRVNYVILGDGYSQEQLDTLFVQHIKKAMTKRFSPIGETYGRYRKFVNICAFKVPSQTSPIGKGATAFKCTGDDQSRLANCDERAADMAIASNIPAGFEVD